MVRDRYQKERGGANRKGMAMVFVAVVLGLLLSASVLWHESSQRATARGAASAVPLEAAQPAATAAATAPAPATAALATASPTRVAAAAVATATPVPTKPVAAAAGSAAEGAKIFAATCNSCHPSANAGLGPSLKGISADVIAKTVREGKDMMPSFGPDEVSDQQLQDIIAYLTSLH